MNNHGLYQTAYDYILNLILTKEYVPGSRIYESQIASTLKISRTPVRSALQQLENDGLILSQANRFCQVAEYTPEKMCELGALRLTLDQLAVKLAFFFGSQADFLSLRQVAQQCLDAYDSGSTLERQRLDCDFHLKLAQISKNETLIDIHNRLYVRVLFIQVHYTNPIYDTRSQATEQLELVNALLERDLERALSIAKKHLYSFYNLGQTFPADFFD